MNGDNTIKNDFNNTKENIYPYTTKAEIRALKGKIKQLEKYIIKQRKKNRQLNKMIRELNSALKFANETLNETLIQNENLVKELEFMKKVKTIKIS